MTLLVMFWINFKDVFCYVCVQVIKVVCNVFSFGFMFYVGFLV